MLDYALMKQEFSQRIANSYLAINESSKISEHGTVEEYPCSLLLADISKTNGNHLPKMTFTENGTHLIKGHTVKIVENIDGSVSFVSLPVSQKFESHATYFTPIIPMTPNELFFITSKINKKKFHNPEEALRGTINIPVERDSGGRSIPDWESIEKINRSLGFNQYPMFPHVRVDRGLKKRILSIMDEFRSLRHYTQAQETRVAWALRSLKILFQDLGGSLSLAEVMDELSGKLKKDTFFSSFESYTRLLDTERVQMKDTLTAFFEHTDPMMWEMKETLQIISHGVEVTDKYLRLLYFVLDDIPEVEYLDNPTPSWLYQR